MIPRAIRDAGLLLKGQPVRVGPFTVAAVPDVDVHRATGIRLVLVGRPGALLEGCAYIYIYIYMYDPGSRFAAPPPPPPLLWSLNPKPQTLNPKPEP